MTNSTPPQSAQVADWIRCDGCKHILFNRDFVRNAKVCPRCSHHHKLTAWERIELLTDASTFNEVNAELSSYNPLDFPEYDQKRAKSMAATEMKDAIVTGSCSIGDVAVVLAVADFRFMGGSMGSVVGEKIVRAAALSLELGQPLVTVSSSGGARMQEGLLSLMQMARTCEAVGKLAEAAIPFISILTDPTTGGVLASYASVADVIIAEPRAHVGFAGQRVAAQAQVSRTPANFQTAEYQLQNGMIDIIVDRKELRTTLIRLLRLMGRS